MHEVDTSASALAPAALLLLDRAKEGMYLVGSSAALSAAADKAIANGRSCMWASVVEHLTAQGCLGKTLQVCRRPGSARQPHTSIVRQTMS